MALRLRVAGQITRRVLLRRALVAAQLAGAGLLAACGTPAAPGAPTSAAAAPVAPPKPAPSAVSSTTAAAATAPATAPSAQASPAAAASAAGTPVRGGRVVAGQPTDITSLNPILGFDDFSRNAWSMFYVPLLRTNPDTGVLDPGLAASFNQSADGTTVTFTLRDGLTWSDGQPFSGEDYRYTLEALARSKKTPRRGAFQNVQGFADYADGKTDSISGITISDGGKTIGLKLTTPFCPALQVLSPTNVGILPRHSFVQGWDNKTTDTSTSIDDHPLNNAPPASMGPFVFKDFSPGVQVSTTRNDRYYLGAPFVDEFIIKVYASNVAIKSALLAGEATFGFGIINPADVDEVQKSGAATLNLFRNPSSGNLFFIAWDNKSQKAPWLAVKEVRQALWYGLNVKAIVDKVRLGYSQQVFGPIMPSSWAYDGTGINSYDYNPAKAKQLLEQAGAKMGPDGIYVWTDGRPMQMRITSFPPFQNDVEIAQQQYQQIGIKIDPVIESLQAMFQDFDAGNFDKEGVMSGTDMTGPDPDVNFGLWHSSQAGPGGNNRVHYSNPLVDQALDAGRNGPDCDGPARKSAYATVMKLINEDAPFTFTYAPDNLVAANKALQGFDPRPYWPHSEWNIEKWWLKP